MKRLVLLTLILFSFTVVNAQQLKFKIAGVPDTTIHLVKYVGKKLFYADTAEIKRGVVSFDGSKQSPGILAILMPDQKYFEFIHNNEDVHIETKAPDFIGNMTIKKSKENQVFYNYIRQLKQNQEESNILVAQRDALPESDTEKREALTRQIKALGDRVVGYQKSMVAENQGLLVAKIINMSIEIDIPEPEDPTDSTFKYRYFRDHFFDHVDFNDDRLVNTPVIQRKLDYFLSPQMLIQHPDTLIKYVGNVVDRTPKGTNMYKFFVSQATSYFEKSKIMGMDKAAVVFIDRYFCQKDEDENYLAFWMDAEKLDDLCKDNKVRLRLVQGEVPPNLILTDTTSKNWIDFHSLENDYVILYFWDPNCGHCKKEIPKLGKLYDEKLKDRNVEVFAVGKATGDDFKAWKKIIREKKLSFINVGVTKEIYDIAKKDPYELIPSKTTLASLNYQETYDIYSTPRVWILDKDKKIIGKNLGISQLEDYLDKIQGFEDAPKLFPVEEKEATKTPSN